MVILSTLAMALVLWVGVAGQGLLASLDLSLGTLTAFVLLLQRFFVPIMSLGNEWQTVQAALAGLERIFQVLALPSEAPAPGSPRQPHYRSNAAIEMREVCFGYLPNRPVLRGVSLAAQPGEHIVLVGRTGAGKSSVLHLLGGLYTPWSGTVRVAGADPTVLTDDERRRAMGVVLQVVQLFRGTVFDNLTLGDGSVSREAVQRAAAIAGADAFIQALPQGYDTLLGSGLQLSAGQRQLLALTRALVWDPAVLLLDEATAAVDSASEAAFRAALRAAVIGCGRTVLTVAHRLATAQEADRVLVMEAGQIVEEGSPEELIRRGGRFAALLELEAGRVGLAGRWDGSARTGRPGRLCDTATAPDLFALGSIVGTMRVPSERSLRGADPAAARSRTRFLPPHVCRLCRPGCDHCTLLQPSLPPGRTPERRGAVDESVHAALSGPDLHPGGALHRRQLRHRAHRAEPSVLLVFHALWTPARLPGSLVLCVQYLDGHLTVGRRLSRPTDRTAEHNRLHPHPVKPFSDRCAFCARSLDGHHPLVTRAFFVQMDAPTSQSYTMAVVAPEEQTAMASTTVTRSVGLAWPVSGDSTVDRGGPGAPFVVGGVVKIAYDLTLWRIRQVKPRKRRQVPRAPRHDGARLSTHALPLAPSFSPML